MKTFFIQTLGCKVNHYESEQIATLLLSRGLTPTDAASADLRVINTCSVTTQAASQSRQSVRRLVRLPVLSTTSQPPKPPHTTTLPPVWRLQSPFGNSSTPRIIVTGCWATSNSADASELPGVTAVISHHQNVAEELDRLLIQWESEENSATPRESGGDGCIATIKAATLVGQRTIDIQPKEFDTVNEKVALEMRSASGEVQSSECRVQTEEKTEEVHHLAGDFFSLFPESGRKRAGRISGGTTTLPLLHLRQPGRQRAFLKIQDGCDAHCTYCIIPSLRPKLWSKPIDDAVEEANSMVAAGHVEIVLTGIFLGAYGQPTALRRRQPQSTSKPIGELINALCTRVPGLRRLRLSSLEPGDLTDDLITILHSHPQVVPHFHLPLQSGSDTLLRRMNRQYTRDDFLRMVDRVRTAFDRPALTTDVVVGFPGETDAEFDRTAEVVRAAGFIHVHAFPYSPRPGTAAARWTNQYVRGPIVNERIERFRAMADDQSLAFRSTFVGQTVELIIERNAEHGNDPPSARHGRCERYFSVIVDKPNLQPGDSVRAKIVQVTRDRTLGRVP